jgi:hypothetical protein
MNDSDEIPDLIEIWHRACVNAARTDPYESATWYADTSVPIAEEIEMARRDAIAGDACAVHYWTEFMRLRMTT